MKTQRVVKEPHTDTDVAKENKNPRAAKGKDLRVNKLNADLELNNAGEIQDPRKANVRRSLSYVDDPQQSK